MGLRGTDAAGELLADWKQAMVQGKACTQLDGLHHGCKIRHGCKQQEGVHIPARCVARSPLPTHLGRMLPAQVVVDAQLHHEAGVLVRLHVGAREAHVRLPGGVGRGAVGWEGEERSGQGVQREEGLAGLAAAAAGMVKHGGYSSSTNT